MGESEAEKAAREAQAKQVAEDLKLQLALYDALKAKEDWEKTHNPDGSEKK